MYYCLLPGQNALPTQGLSSTHLLSLDALLAVVHNFRAWQTTRQDSSFVCESQSQRQVKEGVEKVRKSEFLTPSRGSTRINSAGIIFSSSAENEEEVASLTISTVRSESALAAHVGSDSVKSDEASRMNECISIHDDVIKAASGYMMAIRSTEDELVGESLAVDLPTPKALIEIRQKKKVNNCFRTLITAWGSLAYIRGGWNRRNCHVTLRMRYLVNVHAQIEGMQSTASWTLKDLATTTHFTNSNEHGFSRHGGKAGDCHGTYVHVHVRSSFL